MNDVPKYTQMEIERRWLADLKQIDYIARLPQKRIKDKYLHLTALRLRRETAEHSEIQLKLCKKYGKRDRFSEPIVNIYLVGNRI